MFFFSLYNFFLGLIATLFQCLLLKLANFVFPNTQLMLTNSGYLQYRIVITIVDGAVRDAFV